MSNNIKIENAFSFLEPNGHFEKQSKIERYWDKFNGPFSLNRKRTLNFSVYEGMTHSPLKYFLQQFDLNETLPTNDFIFSGLKNLIITEFSNKELVNYSSYELSPEIKQTYQLVRMNFKILLGKVSGQIESSFQKWTKTFLIKLQSMIFFVIPKSVTTKTN